MKTKNQPVVWQELLANLEQDLFVGRASEKQLFHEFLENCLKSKKILNVCGSAGMGKTCLLQQFRLIAEAKGVLYLPFDIRLQKTPDQLVHALLSAMRVSFPQAEAFDSLFTIALESLHAAATTKRVVLSFDHYEEQHQLDAWLRDRFFPLLPQNVVVVISSRVPLLGDWKLQAAWNRLIQTVFLDPFDLSTVREWADRHGIRDEEGIWRLWVMSRGHPLTLSALNTERNPAPLYGSDPFSEVLFQWVQEIPNEALREILDCAAVLFRFNQEILSHVYDQPVSIHQFESFTRLSLVEKNGQHWRVPDQIRNVLRTTLKHRHPERFRDYHQRAYSYYFEKLVQSYQQGEAIDATLFTELLSYVDNPIIKAHYHLSRESKNRWERIGADNLDEALCYLDRRHRDARSQSVVCADAEVGQLFRYELTAEESLYRIQELNLAELFDVQAEVYVLRRPNGEVAGLSVVIPIKEETLSYLHADNYASPYMNTLRPTEQSRHLEANGCFIRTIDIENVEDESLRHDSFSALLDLLLTYDIVVSSPPPLRYFLESHHILGFTPVTGASHHQYDGITTGQTFLFDRRGSKFIDYLARLVGSSHQLAPKETLPDWEAFTERETEVARLVLEGLSNAQISSTLFISIITVKKHVSAIYRKLNVRNRAQLTKKLIGGNSPHDTRKD